MICGSVYAVPLKWTVAVKFQIPVIKVASRLVVSTLAIAGFKREPGSRVIVLDHCVKVLAGLAISTNESSMTADIAITP